ncbi:Uncharacterised protein [uncultured archaeon]|nr:Uncharacterised protein [uncultured archaeon]
MVNQVCTNIELKETPPRRLNPKKRKLIISYVDQRKRPRIEWVARQISRDPRIKAVFGFKPRRIKKEKQQTQRTKSRPNSEFNRLVAKSL